MAKRAKVDASLLKLIMSKNVTAVDPHRRIVFLKHEKKEDVVKFASLGFKVFSIGEIRFVGRYVMPSGCSLADVADGNTAVTALHCVSDADMRPRETADLLVINESLPEIAKIEALVKSYTSVKKCGWWCRMLLFFRVFPKPYVNYREVAWLEAPVSLSNYKPLPEMETVGVLTAGNDAGDYMMFSPLPGKEDKIQPGTHIAYISFDYRRNRIVYSETYVAGYAFANIVGFIFYLPYAYEPGKTLAIPGYSGSAIKIMNILAIPGYSMSTIRIMNIKDSPNVLDV
jgi:hypothetical protein